MPTLSIAYVHNWADNVATTEVAAAILRRRLGYDVKLQAVSAGLALHGVATGKVDAFLGHCLPVQDEYDSKTKDNIRLVRVNFKDGRCGLAVPEYCNITAINDLKSDSSFKQRIVGIDAGSGIMMKADKVIREHLEGWELQASTEAALTAELAGAYRRQQSIVFTGWMPHWLFAGYELKFLAGGEDYFGNATQTYTVTRLGFAGEHPKAESFFKNFAWTTADSLVEVMMKIRDGAQPAKAAEYWVENSNLVDEWVES